MSNDLVKFQPQAVAVHSIDQMQTMADAFVAAGLFPSIKTKPQAFALMLLCQAKGLHPATAMERYHIMPQGGATLKASAMLEDFRRAGGKVKWHRRDDECVDATFILGDESIRVCWDDARVKRAQLGGNHGKFPAQMKTARCIAEAVRLLSPEIAGGMHTPEEMEDIPQPARQVSIVVEPTQPITQQPATPPPAVVIPPAPEAAPARKPWHVQASDALSSALAEQCDLTDILVKLEQHYADPRKATHVVNVITPFKDQLIAAGHSDALIRMGIIPPPVQQAEVIDAEIENPFEPAPQQSAHAEGSIEWHIEQSPDAQAKFLIELLQNYTSPDDVQAYNNDFAVYSRNTKTAVKKRADVQAAHAAATKRMGIVKP